MKPTAILSFAAAALIAVTTAQAGEITPMGEDDLARWQAAYSEIKGMSPTWGVQGAEAFKTSADAGVPVFYLDVRTDEEVAQGHVEGSTHVALSTLATAEGMAALPEDKNAIIAVYCKSGHRSALAIPFLHSLGYANAVSMSGGYEGWAEAGDPVAGVQQ